MILLPVEKITQGLKIKPNGEEFIVLAKPRHAFPNIELKLARPDAKDLSTDITLTLPIGTLVEMAL